MEVRTVEKVVVVPGARAGGKRIVVRGIKGKGLRGGKEDVRVGGGR